MSMSTNTRISVATDTAHGAYTAHMSSPMGPQWDWGDRLRKVRRTVAHLSQSDMADAIGVKPATYAAWEGNRTEPPMRLSKEVAQRLEQLYPGQVSAAWLLGLDQGTDNAH